MRVVNMMDHESALRWCWLMMTLVVPMVSGNVPNIDYSHNMRILKLPKSLNPGTLIYRLKGSHPDAKALTFGVREAFARQLLEIKSAGFRTADVYLRAPLVEKEYNLTLFVTDGSKSTEVPSTIMVFETDAAILSPFLDYRTIYTVDEDSPHNSTIGYLVAKDKDSSNLPVTFELRGSDNFAIRYVFGPKGTSKAIISLVKDVDYEKRNIYPMTVIALNAWTNETIDTRNVATIDVIIVIKDAEDTAPKFIDLPSVVQISEDALAGNQITTIVAEDGDYEIGRKIAYSLAPIPLSTHFTINRTSGTVFLKDPASTVKKIIGLQNPFILAIQATELSASNEKINEKQISTTAQVAFVIVAFENRPPTFASATLNGFIEENSPLMTAVRWNNYSLPIVSDPDSGLNGTMDLMLNSDKHFTIQPNWGLREVTFSLLSKNPVLDYETGPREVILTIIATDHSPARPLSAKIQCKITIVDLNDNFPQFVQQNYEASLYEDAPIGTKLLKVEALDKDSGVFGKIKYTSINGPIAKNLLLDSTTGLITLKSLEGIDRELTPEYTLTIEARDENGFGNKNVTQLMVKILDANDNEPKFVQPRYDAVLNPDLVTFTQPLMVKAIDSDQPNTLNSQVVYEIIGGNYQGKFSINNLTGEIMIRSPLTFEKTTKFVPPFGDRSIEVLPSIVLTVRAHDRGIPYRYSTIKVHIHNKDFLNRTVSFVIEEDESRVWSRKEEIENTLTSIVGAEVHVHSVRPDSSNPKLSRIDTWISYPLHSSIDLRNVDKLLDRMHIKGDNQGGGGDGQGSSSTNDVQTAALHPNNYELVIWIILLLIFITLLFLITLLCIWCLCYRNDRKTETNQQLIAKDDGNFKHSRLRRAENGHITMREVVEEVSNVKSSSNTKKKHHFNKNNNESKREVSSGSGDEPSRMQRIKMNRHQRSRIAPELVGDEQIYLNTDPEYVLMKRARISQPMYSDSIIHDIPRSHPGAYVIDESGHNYYLLPRSDENFPSRRFVSQDDGYRLRRAGSLREQDFRQKNQRETFRSSSEARVRDDRNDDNNGHHHGIRREGPSSFHGTKGGGHYSDNDDHQHHHIIDGEKYSNQRRRKAGDDDVERNGRSNERDERMSGSLPGSVEDDGEDGGTGGEAGRPHSDTQSDIDMGLIDGVVFGASRYIANGEKHHEDGENPSENSRQRQHHHERSQTKTETAIKMIETADVSDKSSDSDSGIGRSRMERKLNLKNSDLMTKKSIFTIAYDDVKTDRLKSADSVPSTPPVAGQPPPT
ncbi:cadherin-86C-like [Brevipalpus obovatus]|uniref:cadherin-86C-like n=1 Tax=Brevipalpus obovatus TaxID=246614 RepID=UPI003D9F8719